MKISSMILLILIIFTGCDQYKIVKRLSLPPNSTSIDQSIPYLKAHMNDGTVYVFSEWSINDSEKMISGQAELLSVNRELIKNAIFDVSLDSVVIIETNVLEDSPHANAIAILTGLSVGISIYCLSNPKACFGSCPTFYVSDGDSLVLSAEGFSSSIAPSLEATDIDALYSANITDNIFEIEMRNEALETHVVDYVNLLLLPKSDDNRVFCDSDGMFWETSEIFSPDICIDNIGNCLSDVIKFDGLEWYSEADSFNLAEKEIIQINFDDFEDDQYGIIIGARQTLLTTFLFYQTLSYMGTNVGEWMSLLEREKTKAGNPFALLGGIELVLKDDEGFWQTIGKIEEIGPIATDMHIIPLPKLTGENINLGLRMTKGNWRIDYIALASITDTKLPIRIQPSTVYSNNKIDENALSLLLDPFEKLTTLPGDTYNLVYTIPDDFDSYEFFLESRGYYLEWMRNEWIEEENPERLFKILFSPEQALIELASDFKEIEADMEDTFWRSKYGTK
jgi:hypothetical protein